MDFRVLIIGTDANAYYMARCCFEAYNKKATLLGHSFLPFTGYSDILNLIYNPKIWEEEEFIKAIYEIKSTALQNKPTLLISSNETYAGFISKNSEKLIKDGFLLNYPSTEIINTLMYKDLFYKTYENDLCVPKTVYYDCSVHDRNFEGLTYPVVLKPSNVILYNHLDFAGKNKIYKIESETELLNTVDKIVDGGYNDCLIIQDFIPGDDSYLFDAVAYADSKGKVDFISFAQIGLQEQTKSMVGNAAVLINGYNQFGNTEETAEKLKNFLEKIGYRGFAEFDLKYDKRDKKFKVLEINARQGRSSYYLTALGKNLVKVLVDDLVFDKQSDFKVLKDEVLLSFVPKTVIKKYIKNRDYQKKALSLWKNKVNPIDFKSDKNFKRKLYLIKRKFRYLRDYKNSYWTVD